mmetsp:Transcript_4325/g.9699  ORF Transcript_4325/g.9699 Transcript_4325/m.9699 type:complete len:336 (+) Transcript_4325:151-1158(+)
MLLPFTAVRQSAITRALDLPARRLAAFWIIWLTSFSAASRLAWFCARTLYPPISCPLSAFSSVYALRMASMSFISLQSSARMIRALMRCESSAISAARLMRAAWQSATVRRTSSNCAISSGKVASLSSSCTVKYRTRSCTNSAARSILAQCSCTRMKLVPPSDALRICMISGLPALHPPWSHTGTKTSFIAPVLSLTSRGTRKFSCTQLSSRSNESRRVKLTLEVGMGYWARSLSMYLKAANLGRLTEDSNTCSRLPRLRVATCVCMRSVQGLILAGRRGSTATLLWGLVAIARISLSTNTTPSRSTATRFTICTSELTSTVSVTAPRARSPSSL